MVITVLVVTMICRITRIIFSTKWCGSGESHIQVLVDSFTLSGIVTYFVLSGQYCHLSILRRCKVPPWLTTQLNRSRYSKA